MKLYYSSSLENSSSPSVIRLDRFDFLISSALLLSYIGSMPFNCCFFLFLRAYSRFVSSSSELLSDFSDSSSLLSSDSCSSLNSLDKLANSFSVILGSGSGGCYFLRAEGSDWSSISFSESCSDSIGRGSGIFFENLLDRVSSSGIGVGVGTVEVKLNTGPPTSMAPDFIFSLYIALSSSIEILLFLSTMRL